MTDTHLIIIGAGPAGMTAARRAAETGLAVHVLDEQPSAGGQIYRDVERVAPVRGDIIGKEYAEGLPLVQRLDHPNITHVTGAVVWQIGKDGQVAYTRDGTVAQLRGHRILLATGALERPMPLPGWTLPGVMTAGAAQILLKQSGLVPQRAVLIGSGPLLYLIAVQMVRAGTPPLALVETQSAADFRRAVKHLPGAVRGWRYLFKGMGFLNTLRRDGVRRYTGATNLTIDGQGRAEAVSFSSGAQARSIACDTVLLHHGVVPNVQAARSLDVPHRWDARQSCFVPERDGWGRTILDRVFIAGDSAGIGGASAAELSGQLAALAIACDLERFSIAERNQAARPLRMALARELAVRPFIDTAFPPCAEALSPADATLICRCEEVAAGDIRNFARLGCLGPNQAKAFGRAGMGLCQGRYCGLTVTGLLAEANGMTPEDTGYFRIRPPLKSVTLGELAALDDPGASIQSD